MARKEYLTSNERLRFDTPPQLEDIQILFDIPAWAELYLQTLTTSTNKIGFLLQLGYFRITSRFYKPNTFYEHDILALAEKFSVDPNDVLMTDYAFSRTCYRHQERILYEFGYHAFTSDFQKILLDEAKRLTYVQTKPALIFDTLVNFLLEKRIEIPTYNALRDILTTALDEFGKDLEAIIQNYLTPSDKLLLDILVTKQSENLVNSDYERYELTFFKKISQSMQNKSIKERLDLFVELKKRYFQLSPVIKRLKLTDATIRYFADYIIDNQSAQVSKRVNEYYLQLIAFVIHQYFSIGDALVITINNAVVSTFNDAENKLKDDEFGKRMSSAQLVNKVTKRSATHIIAFEALEDIVDNQFTDDSQKVKQVRQLILEKKLRRAELREDQKRIEDLKLINQPIIERDDFYQSLEKESVRLQMKISNIIIELDFDKETSQTDIWQAVEHYQFKKGEISNTKVPVYFLDMDERQKIFTQTGKLKISIYKALLFREINQHIKAGSLNVASSYEYRSFEEYLIPKSQWAKQKDTLLGKANLTKYANAAQTLLALNTKLNLQFEKTNNRLKENKVVYFDKEGAWHLHRDQTDKNKPQLDTKNIYPPNRSISILEVLTQINQLTGFLNAFQHKTQHYSPPRPHDNYFFAAIIGYGENIGITEMGDISKNIEKNTLQTVATQYFSPEMTLRANDLILSMSNKLPIIDFFRRQSNFVHTVSDGQKYDVSIPFLRSSASFKYFGSGKGVTIYSHLDEAGQLIFSTVFSASDREAHHLLNGLTYNVVITPDAHTTDTHGHTEAVSAITWLISIEHRPRLAGIHNRQLYSIDAVWTYKELDYKIAPDAKIDYDHLVSQWDEILRLTATIKLGYNMASTLFNRLNSYARKHPLNKAINDLGRLTRTEYTLRYIDDPELRKSVEGVLSIVEHSNNFGSAITGINHQFSWTTVAEQLTAEGCKRLIMNAINYYNLLLLSSKITECKTEMERGNLLDTVSKSSTHTWRHFNLIGNFIFTDLGFIIPFDLDSIMAMKLSR